ncbi:MAG: hypothetical protein AAFP90_23230, partial [Planctomycetota bacterium]
RTVQGTVVAPPQRVLVVLVPSMYGMGTATWQKRLADESTLASRLAETGPEPTTIVDIQWSRDAILKPRSLLAEKIVDVIDSRADQFDRVVIIGHSQGGNLALLAAGFCKRPSIRLSAWELLTSI